MVIAAVDVAVVDVARRVNRLDVIVAAAHYRAEHFALALGEVRADYDIVVFGVIVESVTRHPGETRPTPAVVGVVEFDYAVFALEVFEPGLGNGGAVFPARGYILYRAGIVKALDFVDSRRVALDNYILRDLVISAVVRERIAHFVSSGISRGEGLAVGKVNRRAAIGYACRAVGGSEFISFRDKLRAGNGDRAALCRRAGVCVCFKLGRGNLDFQRAQAVDRFGVILGASVVGAGLLRREFAVRKLHRLAVGVNHRERDVYVRRNGKRDFLAAAHRARGGNRHVRFLRRLYVGNVQRARADFAVHQPAT